MRRNKKIVADAIDMVRLVYGDGPGLPVDPEPEQVWSAMHDLEVAVNNLTTRCPWLAT